MRVVGVVLVVQYRTVSVNSRTCRVVQTGHRTFRQLVDFAVQQLKEIKSYQECNDKILIIQHKPSNQGNLQSIYIINCFVAEESIIDVIMGTVSDRS